MVYSPNHPNVNPARFSAGAAPRVHAGRVSGPGPGEGHADRSPGTPAAPRSGRRPLGGSPAGRRGRVWPAAGWLLARVDVRHAFAPPTAHVAAPDELALAALHVPHHVRVVAAAAAEQVAAVGALGRPVALPALRPRDAQPVVLHAVIGGLVQVEQVLLANRDPPLLFLSPAHFPPGFLGDLNTVLVLVLQQVADLFKGRHGSPARFDSARAGDPVAAAVHGHQLGDSLKPTETALSITGKGLSSMGGAHSPPHFISWVCAPA